MPYTATMKRYLRSLQSEYEAAIRGGQHTAELSFRTPMDTLFRALAHDLNPGANHIDIVLEPRNQGRVGRPDWRIHDNRTLGIYGYIEGKGLSAETFDITPYTQQINRYLTLGHKLIITDGLDFVFCMNANADPIIVSIINKAHMATRNWSDLEIDPQFEIYMRSFFDNPAPQQVSESKLVELVAVRTRILADSIKEYADIPEEEAISGTERQAIELLNGLRDLVYSHNDPRLRTGSVFADFTAQVIMFCLLYAHRVLCESTDAPTEKESKIRRFIASDISEGDELAPFRNVMLYLEDNADIGSHINQWVDECIKFLSFVQMTDEQLQNPDYHKLFEHFLAEYDAKIRFDYGAFYTPKVLADFVVKLTNYVVEKDFNGASIYDDGNTIIDPCCGTGSFLEEVVAHDTGDGAYNLCGFEILPAPYMLANYRMAVVERTLRRRAHRTHIILANTLSNSVFDGTADENTIEGRELNRASQLSTLPLKLIIGNPPSSDAMRSNVTNDFSTIQALMEDFRPPVEERHGRQNIQKQINNPFLQFVRWSCKKLLDSPNHAALAFVVPLSFLEAESYKYARKYLANMFSDAWICAIDADARTGVRSDGLFPTMQGRAVVILTKMYNEANQLENYHFCNLSRMTRAEKEVCLASDINSAVELFSEFALNMETYSFYPAEPFNEELYSKFWPVSGAKGQQAVFLNHCSGIKLAPTAIFTHVKSAILKRRSKEIASGGVPAAKPWFVKQDRAPKDGKIYAFQTALNNCGDAQSIDRLLATNIKTYTFRPFLTSNVLLWPDLLKQYARVEGGGTRLRPEIISAYENANTIGFAMAHAPKDLNPTLSQFVSFCWYYPDNDMCSRGNSHIYMNQFPEKRTGQMVANINENLLYTITELLEIPRDEAAKNIVFYVFAILCSQIYLDEFEGALNTVNQSGNRARVPFVNSKDIFNQIVYFGRKIAELEKSNYTPENVLSYDYQALMESVPVDFYLQNFAKPFDEENQELILSDGTNKIRVYCPITLQHLNISGYDVIKNSWLKFNSYDYTHCSFDKDDMRKLLDFLNTLATHAKYVAQLDDVVREILIGNVELIQPQP